MGVLNFVAYVSCWIKSGIGVILNKLGVSVGMGPAHPVRSIYFPTSLGSSEKYKFSYLQFDLVAVFEYCTNNHNLITCDH